MHKHLKLLKKFFLVEELDNFSSMLDILMYALENTSINIENVCLVLLEYLKSRKLI